MGPTRTPKADSLGRPRRPSDSERSQPRISRVSQVTLPVPAKERAGAFWTDEVGFQVRTDEPTARPHAVPS